ncbi:MAG TPA: FadR/GntR family transcriptional regulator [Actinokineospora sp.]|nr:FadR/GntR family transcriptional regulator [Actinokineospora sp.]
MTNQAAFRSGGGRPRPARLAVSVVHDLIDAVVGGKIDVGEALPGEQALCEEFQVSRIVIREAMQSLRQKGLVVIRQGHGTVIAPAAQWNPLDEEVLDARLRHDESLTVLNNLIQVRVALECEMAAAAALRRTDEQAAELDRMLAVMDTARGDHERYLALDLEFHDLVMEFSGNDVGRAVVAGIHGHARASTRYSGGTPTAAHLRHAQAGHAEVAAAVGSGDEEAARAAMRSHILESWQRKSGHKAGGDKHR